MTRAAGITAPVKTMFVSAPTTGQAISVKYHPLATPAAYQTQTVKNLAATWDLMARVKAVYPTTKALLGRDSVSVIP